MAMKLLRKALGMAELDALECQLSEALADLEHYTAQLQRDAELFPFLEDEDP